ncbi:hypothetical protein [uncultured Kiloniella sp.]|uniref:hypothetical protein n=1 Tax=uncultured Kiloniella sp. TaxID=1133091 RepID=UPI002637BFB3|nr:hypothetical protein [uncultured Kiloniella sp.]
MISVFSLGVIFSLGMATVVHAEVKASQDGVITIEEEDCRRLMLHHLGDDVAYTPGVTKKGKKVVPADLNAQPIVLPEIIRIPITVDMFERYNIPANKANFEADAEIGVVEVHKNGEAFFNGQRLQSEEQRELSLKCQEILDRE